MDDARYQSNAKMIDAENVDKDHSGHNPKAEAEFQIVA
jgi:hypothetical protein